MKLEITQEHITEAKRLRELAGYTPSDNCVLALALAEQYPKEKRIGTGVFFALASLAGPYSYVHNLAGRIASNFDNRRKVEPCTLRWRKRKEALVK